MAQQLSEDLAQHRTIILSLISYATHAKLDTLIEKLTPKLNNNKRFLIKMEIKRLAKPCALVIDFRPYFDNCEPVIHQNVCHYLDKISKSLFLDSVKNNNGLFSIHIYNELNDKAKVRHRDIVNTQGDSMTRVTTIIEDIQQLSLVNTNFFEEPQVTGKSTCGLFSYDPLGMSKKGKLEVAMNVTTLDLNANACIIKAPLEAIANENQPVYLWFYQHDEALEFQQEIVLEYHVEDHKKPQSGITSHYLLRLSQSSDDKMISALSELLSKRIELTNKSQTRQVQPLIASINAKCHEQFLLNNTVDIPMLCAKYKTGWRPSICLKTPSNHSLWQFFSDENGQDPLARLFTNMKIQSAMNQSEKFDDYAYILKHQYGNSEYQKQQYVIIWQSELVQDNSAHKLLSRYILTGDYRYIRLRVLPIDSQQDAYIPSALPDYINSTMALLNRPHTKKATKLLKASNQLAILTDITELNDVLALEHTLTKVKLNKIINEPIKCPIKFIIPQLARKSVMEVATINNNDLRAEDRFEYQLNLVINYSDKQSINVAGITKNISSRGLLVELSKPVKLKSGANLRLTIEMPYRGKLLTMQNQPYLLLNSNGDRQLRLTINGSESKHAACQAIREHIYKHMDNLTHCGFDSKNIFGLQKAMRNIYANNHLSVPFFIHQGKLQWHISSIAVNQNTEIQNFNGVDNCVKTMLLQMVEQEKFRNYSLSLLNKTSEENPVEIFYILTLPRKSKHKEHYNFWFSDIEQLQKNGQLKQVLDQIRSVKKPSILRVQLSRVNKIINTYFRDELQYLEQISSTSAQEITDTISSLTGIGEITDHTEQVLQLFDHFIAKNELAKVS